MAYAYNGGMTEVVTPFTVGVIERINKVRTHHDVPSDIWDKLLCYSDECEFKNLNTMVPKTNGLVCIQCGATRDKIDRDVVSYGDDLIENPDKSKNIFSQFFGFVGKLCIVMVLMIMAVAWGIVLGLTLSICVPFLTFGNQQIKSKCQNLINAIVQWVV